LRISGLNKLSASKIIDWRTTNGDESIVLVYNNANCFISIKGGFKSRSEILEVLGPTEAFQAMGLLRVINSNNPLG